MTAADFEFVHLCVIGVEVVMVTEGGKFISGRAALLFRKAY